MTSIIAPDRPQKRRTVITNQTLQRMVPKPAKPGDRVELWDAYLEGFGYRATVKGKGTFFVMYRHEGKQRRFTVGRYPVMTLEQARTAAATLLAQSRRGADPKIEQSDKLELEQQRVARTVSNAVADFLTLYPRYRPTTRAQVTRLLNKELLPTLGAIPISDVTRKHMAGVINAVSDRGSPITANRVFAYSQSLFGWLIKRGELEASPLATLGKPSKEQSRDRVLTDTEIVAVWRGAEAMGHPYGTLVQLLILTGQRREEVAGMRWQDIDRSNKVWRLPRDQTKSARAHDVPLAPATLKLIGKIPANDGPLMFPPGKLRKPKDDDAPRHISGWSPFNRMLDVKVLTAFAQASAEPSTRSKQKPATVSTVEPWVLHDLRRTMASKMAGLGVVPHVVERLLNHSAGSIRGVAAVYNRHSYADEMRAAATLWASHITRLVKPTGADRPAK